MAERVTIFLNVILSSGPINIDNLKNNELILHQVIKYNAYDFSI